MPIYTPGHLGTREGGIDASVAAVANAATSPPRPVPACDAVFNLTLLVQFVGVLGKSAAHGSKAIGAKSY